MAALPSFQAKVKLPLPPDSHPQKQLAAQFRDLKALLKHWSVMQMQPWFEIIRLFQNTRNMNSLQTVEALRALAHEHRLAAYRALVQAGPAGMAVGELRETLGLPAATLTAHLNQLRAASLVTDEREGRVIRIRADYPRMNALIGFLTENCCGGEPCVPLAQNRSR